MECTLNALKKHAECNDLLQVCQSARSLKITSSGNPKKGGEGLQLTDYNDLMNFAAKPGVALPETFEECGERRM